METVTYEPNVALIPTRRYAGFWIRFAALLLDTIVLQALNMSMNYGLGVNIWSPPLGIALIQSMISILYYVVMTVLLGQTLGKMAVGIRVIGQDGGGPGWGVILIRETIGKFVSTLILFIGFIMTGFDPKKRALHDRMSRTFVIKG